MRFWVDKHDVIPGRIFLVFTLPKVSQLIRNYRYSTHLPALFYFVGMWILTKWNGQNLVLCVEFAIYCRGMYQYLLTYISVDWLIVIFFIFWLLIGVLWGRLPGVPVPAGEELREQDGWRAGTALRGHTPPPAPDPEDYIPGTVRYGTVPTTGTYRATSKFSTWL
jgi:hypothetical protein